jgi:monoamine oxidase
MRAPEPPSTPRRDADATDRVDRPITRRAFVARSAAIAASLAGAACGGGAKGAAATVIVAGAGLAGLSAAYELVRMGHRVTVLEARDRPGGRVLTLRDGFDGGLHVEAGAIFVREGHDHTVGYARELGVRLVPAGGRARGAGARCFIRGRSVRIQPGEPVQWPVQLSPAEAGLTAVALRARYLDPVLDELGDPSHPSWPSAGALRYDALSLGALLRTRGASPGAVEVMRLGYLDEWGDGVERCSALSLLRDLAQQRGGGAAYVVEGGTDRLPRAFAASLGGRVRYGTAVTEIHHGADGVRVGFRERGGGGTLSADYLVCALPFPLLREVRVSPPFSPGKRAAVEGLRTTSVTRVYLQLRERCWPAGEAAVPTDLPVMHLGDATAGQPGPRGVLEAFVTGPNARRIAAMEPEARVAFAREQAGRVHPGVDEAFERGASYCWDADPWARGDYAWFAPGELGAFLPHLARPEGRVHFAGDHTSPLPGWMQGALASGRRAAEAVHAAATSAEQ